MSNDEIINVAKEVAMKGLPELITLGLAFFWRQLVWMVTGMMPDIPKVRGTWKTTFVEPKEDGTHGPLAETATLKQIGRYIRGSVAGGANGTAMFKLSGHLVGTSFFGTFERTKNPGAPGTGSFLLCVQGTGDKMIGWSIWHDIDTNKAEASQYIWTRIHD